MMGHSCEDSAAITSFVCFPFLALSFEDTFLAFTAMS